MNLNIFSDLRKPGLVPGESLSLSTKIDSVLENIQSCIMSNRMRSIHMHLNIEYGRDSVKIFCMDGRNMRGRWQTLPTTKDSLLDVSPRDWYL